MKVLFAITLAFFVDFNWILAMENGEEEKPFLVYTCKDSTQWWGKRVYKKFCEQKTIVTGKSIAK